MAATHIPKYRIHLASGQAVVTLSGETTYLGRYGSGESREKYALLVAEWLGRGRRPRGHEPAGITVGRLAGEYEAFAAGYYRKAGRATSHLANVRRALRGLVGAHGGEPAAAFGPRKLRGLAEAWAAEGLTRQTAEKYRGIVAAAFRWAVAEELVPPDVWHGLRAVRGLARGRSGAPEGRVVGPAPAGAVEAVLGALEAEGPRAAWRAPIAAMIRLQLATGMRPGEVLGMRRGDLERDDGVWTYRVGADVNKEAHAGRERTVYLGPAAVGVVGPWYERTRLDSDHLFHPPGRRKYGRTGYWQAIDRWCARLGVESWHPNQLRHTAATRLRAEHGLEAARLILGHADAGTTIAYAERDSESARAIAGRSC